MIIFVIILVYILSIIGSRYALLLQSSKYWNNFDNEDCTVHIFWFLPIINTLYFILLIIFGIIAYYKNKPKTITKNKLIRWFFNYHLLDKPF